MEKFIQEVDQSKLVLISKSKNKPGLPIFREDLPQVLFNKAPRILLGSKWFDQYSSKFPKTFICESCRKQLPLERHELYGLYKYGNQYIIRLEGIMRICSSCHKKIHGGFSSRLNMRYGAISQPVPVSDALNPKKYPWNEAKLILIENNLYLL